MSIFFIDFVKQTFNMVNKVYGKNSITRIDKMSEGKIHKEIRTKLFMTCTKFAKTYNISRATVSGWGNGKKISAKHCKFLSDLGISQDAIENPYDKQPEKSI